MWLPWCVWQWRDILPLGWFTNLSASPQPGPGWAKVCPLLYVRQEIRLVCLVPMRENKESPQNEEKDGNEVKWNVSYTIYWFIFYVREVLTNGNKKPTELLVLKEMSKGSSKIGGQMSWNLSLQRASYREEEIQHEAGRIFQRGGMNVWG